MKKILIVICCSVLLITCVMSCDHPLSQKGKEEKTVEYSQYSLDLVCYEIRPYSDTIYTWEKFFKNTSKYDGTEKLNDVKSANISSYSGLGFIDTVEGRQDLLFLHGSIMKYDDSSVIDMTMIFNCFNGDTLRMYNNPHDSMVAYNYNHDSSVITKVIVKYINPEYRITKIETDYSFTASGKKCNPQAFKTEYFGIIKGS